MSEEEFAAQVEELAKNKLQRPKKLATLANRWVPEIILRRCEWSRHEAEVGELKTLTHADVVEFVESTIMSATSSRKLCVHVKGAAEIARGAAETQEDKETCKIEEATNVAKQAIAATTDGEATNGQAMAKSVVKEDVCDAGGSGKAAETPGIRVEADQLSQFRLSQPLWPLPRHVW